MKTIRNATLCGLIGIMTAGCAQTTNQLKGYATTKDSPWGKIRTYTDIEGHRTTIPKSPWGTMTGYFNQKDNRLTLYLEDPRNDTLYIDDITDKDNDGKADSVDMKSTAKIGYGRDLNDREKHQLLFAEADLILKFYNDNK